MLVTERPGFACVCRCACVRACLSLSLCRSVRRSVHLAGCPAGWLAVCVYAGLCVCLCLCMVAGANSNKNNIDYCVNQFHYLGNRYREVEKSLQTPFVIATSCCAPFFGDLLQDCNVCDFFACRLLLLPPLRSIKCINKLTGGPFLD